MLLFFILNAVPNKEGEDERIITGTLEAAHALLAGKHAIFYVSR